MTPELTAAWYCIRSQPKHEHLAAAHLRLLPEVEVFCPRLRQRKATRRGPVWFNEALFPGYLFARFELALSQKLVTYASGVTAIVSFREGPAPIGDEVIAGLREAVGETECHVLEESVNEGDEVVVTTGPFHGLTSVVTRVMPAQERVRILLEFLGHAREVEVARESLLPARRHLMSRPTEPNSLSL